MADKIGVAILAAGMGKRMGVSTAKPLIPLMGRCLVDYTIDAAKNFGDSIGAEIKLGIVVGHQKENVEAHVSKVHSALSPAFPVQEKQLGTADALKSYFNGCSWSEDTDYTLVLCADTPMLTAEELTVLWNEMQTKNLDAVAATFSVANPFGYGRILRGSKGFKIVEEKDATDKEREIDEVNSGLYIFKTKEIREALGQVNSQNKAGEFYLTDVFQQDKNVGAILFADPKPFQGINNPQQLSSALHDLKIRINRGHQGNGVLILDTAHTYIEPSVKIGVGTTVFANCFLHGETIIGEAVTLEPGCIIKDSKIDNGVKVKAYSYFEEAHVSSKSQVGPYARLRPGADLGEGCKVGNFVEIKKANLEKDVSVSHLSYIGDAEIGENVNIGCGFITCNYDGGAKHKTKIGKNSFIGSDTQMIAPVTIGESAFVASGSTINQDVPDKGFAVARGRQVTKEKMASRFLKGKWAISKD